MKRVITMVLVLVMVLGMLPSGSLLQASAAETKDSIVIDFEDFVQKAKEEDFWQTMFNQTGTASAEGSVKFIGRLNATRHNDGYDEMLDYLWANHGWTIDETATFLKTTNAYTQGIILNANADSGWSFAYRSGTAGDGEVVGGSVLKLIVDVEEEGYYKIDTTAYYAARSSNFESLTGLANNDGGAYANIFVNDVPAREGVYAFTGQTPDKSSTLTNPNTGWANSTQTDTVGYAYFNKGRNEITFDIVAGTYGRVGTADGMRCWIHLDSIELIPAGEPELNVTIPGVKEQVARNTVQKFELNLTDDYGNPIDLSDVTIGYEVSDDDIIEIDKKTHTFRTLKNGDVTVIVTASADDVEASVTVELTVADVGEDRFIYTDSTFEDANTIKHWATSPGKTRFNITTVEDDGSGSNNAMKVSTDPEISYSTSLLGAVLMMNKGYFAEVYPGHMYEMSFRVKTEGYQKAPGAAGDLGLDVQMYAYSENNTANNLDDLNVARDGLGLKFDEWTEIRFMIKAPLEGEKPIYITPRIVLRPVGYKGADKDVSGWEMTAWFDDFSIREVGFEGVDLELDSVLTDTVQTAQAVIKPYATNGSFIDIAAASVADMVKLTSTNGDVVEVVSAPVRTQDSSSPNYFPVGKVKLGGLNAEAELVANVTIHGVTQEASVDMTQTDLPDVLRDISYTLGDAEAVTLKTGETAEGKLTGRTTQLQAFTEEELREGSVYFVSSNTDVAIVDQTTGDVTCVNEGTATVTVYVIKDGITVSDSVALTVSDETDLASIEIVSSVDYVGVDNTMQLRVQGRKASGIAADMSKYSVAWSVDNSEVASVDENGRLTGLAAGTVNVTATVGVMGTEITDIVTVTVVPNDELASTDVILDFTNGHLMNIQDCTIEEDGVEINCEETYNNGKDAKTIHKYGFGFNAPVGEQLAIDFVVKRDGCYRVEAGGGLFTGGNISEVYVDEYYAGSIDFCAGKNGQPYAAKLEGNTVYLEAGKHTFYVVSTTKGLQFLGKLILRAATDSSPISVKVSAPKAAIIPGETMELAVKATDKNGKIFHLKYEKELSGNTGCYMTSSTNSAAATVSGNTITGVKAGSATMDVKVSVNGEVKTYSVDVKVDEGTVASAGLAAEETTFKPNGGSEQLQVIYYDVAGEEMAKPSNATVSYETSDDAIASVSADGIVTAGTKEGSARIVATVTEGEHVVEAAVWITVTTGKTAPTIYTMEERANAKENSLQYNWAWRTRESAVDLADYVINNFDTYYNALIREGLPRTYAVYREGYNGVRRCPGCNIAVEDVYNVYGWIVDPINNPWKITCPECDRDFPSNDFESYYKSGLDEHGYFSADRADPKYLVNELYPEMNDPTWGVDDGTGWLSGESHGGVAETFNFIAYYNHMVFRPRGKAEHGLLDGLMALADAYVYTGEEKYGVAGVKLLARVAEIYPEYDMTNYKGSIYANSDGGSGRGKFTGAIWEGDYVAPLLARASDALWPAMSLDAAVQYLKADALFYGVDPETITTEYLRNEVDEGILLEIREGVENTTVAGNFGMPQESMALAAVALDRLPETEEMLDWTFRYGETLSSPTVHATGGNVYYNLVNLVDRNGFGNEVSYKYNNLWYINLMGVADALADYTRVEGVNLWEFSKFVELFRGFGRNIQGGLYVVQFGETGSIQSQASILIDDLEAYLVPAYQNTKDPLIAQMVYAGNGNSVKGLHADIFTKNPESIADEILNVINTQGPLDMGKSAQLAGYGMTVLRTGPVSYIKSANANEYFSTSLYYGLTNSSHAQLEALSLNLFAFGLDFTANLGYPVSVSSDNPNRTQWFRNTVSHNTVVVDDEGQLETEGGFPLHYDDADHVQLVDADASNAYAQTDIYRRTFVTVKAPNGVPYTVDFFRVLGGEEHVYSFHANSISDPETEGLDFVHQSMGTYAGPDVPYGPRYIHPTSTDVPYNQGNGYSWLKNVYRDDTPESSFTVDWQIKDFHNMVATSEDLHMKITMLSEEPMSEVALADGAPPQDGVNPELVKYMLVRRSGEKGMDTLFTSVIETYQYNDQIASSELVGVELIEGKEGPMDKASAIKVTMHDGREDYIVYATNPDCTYKVDNKFTFTGFVGVCSYYDDSLYYAYGNEATTVADVVEEIPAVTGKIVDFTKGLSNDGYTITVSADQDLTGVEFVGRCIYVKNDRVRNAVYQIEGAEVAGDTVTLDIGHETLARSYLDGNDLDAGFIYDIAVGQDYTIPLSVSAPTVFAYVEDQTVKVGEKLSMTVGLPGIGATYKLVGGLYGMKFDSTTGLLTWTPTKSRIGDHTFTVEATTAEGETFTTTITIHVVGETAGVINLYGTNMTLGNELVLNLLFLKKDVDAVGKKLTAHLIHHHPEQGDLESTVDLEKYGDYYKASFKIAAKQMADEVTVELRDENGTVYSKPNTQSARNYLMSCIRKEFVKAEVSELLAALMVDMLNYGAEAQKYFEYDEKNLATSKLAAEHKAMASEPQTGTNTRVEGANYHGTNLTLEEKILLNLYFNDVTPDMYAEITFTDYRGRPQKVDVPFEEFRTCQGRYGVVVDDIVVSDSFCPVTVTVYNADGTVHGTATDSVESYCARPISDNTGALCQSIMQFASSAKAYLLAK